MGGTMILDRLEHAAFYRGLSPQIAAALDYLQTTDLAALADGRYELDGERLVAIVQRYRPKPLRRAVWESHRRYVDVQYVVSGVERMGWAALSDALPVRAVYDPARDAAFYDLAARDGLLFPVGPGSFAVFTPHDVHAPGLAPAGAPPGEVCKVVMKCLLAG
jgi:YhcH/YjgK/YiaL family protein